MTRPVSTAGGSAGGVILPTALGALVGAWFGRVWLGFAAHGLPAWQAGMARAGWIVCAAFVLWALLAAWRTWPAPPSWSLRPWRGWPAWLGLLFLAEGLLIGAGHAWLGGRLGHPEWVPAWTLLVVGAHFWLLGLMLRIEAFRVLSLVMMALAMLTAPLAAVLGAAACWWLPGFGGAAALWGFAGWALYRLGQGRSLALRRPDQRAASSAP